MRYIRKANLAMVFIVVGSLLYLGNLYGQRLAEKRRDQCFRNLGMIEAGMEACALEIHSKIGDSLPKDKIRPYFKNGKIPQCPSGGQYEIPVVGQMSKCSYHGVLPIFYSDSTGQVKAYQSVSLQATNETSR